MRPMIWFRSDLRIADNTALDEACGAAGDGVIGVLAVCPAQWRLHDWGANKVDFVLRNAAALSTALARLNIPLRIVCAARFGELPAALVALAERTGCDALYFNREYEVNELQRDDEVTRAFERSGRRVRGFDDQTIVPPGRLRTGSGGWYTVFSPFRKKWIEAVRERRGVRLRPAPTRQRVRACEPDIVPTSLPEFVGRTCSKLWPAGERAARQMLRRFIDERAGTYHVRRDLPSMDGTSTLSPWLACGAISARQCLSAALEANRNRLDSGSKGITVWINELIWREFYRHVLVGYPRVCRNQPFRPETERIRWREDEAGFRAWCEGRTGVPIVDAGMRQLAQTGWMHNRVRMITAMFLTKDLLIDWRRGERHFMQCLVDGDFANNNGGWQWSASTGTDAAPYFRMINPSKQSRRYDAEGEYIRRFVPELVGVPDEEVHGPVRGWRSGRRIDYPEPIVDHAQARDRLLAAFRRIRSTARGKAQGGLHG